MNLQFTVRAWEDYLFWQQQDRATLKSAKEPASRFTNNPETLDAGSVLRVFLRRINQLIRDTQRSPFEGLGQPEPLRFSLSGYWSRRIDSEHRFGLLCFIRSAHHSPMPLSLSVANESGNLKPWRPKR